MHYALTLIRGLLWLVAFWSATDGKDSAELAGSQTSVVWVCIGQKHSYRVEENCNSTERSGVFLQRRKEYPFMCRGAGVRLVSARIRIGVGYHVSL